MPVVDLESPDVRAPRDTPKNFFVTPGAEDFDIPALTDVQPMPLPPPEKRKPTEEEINRAALRTDNTIASAISAGFFTAPRHIQEGFNAWEKIKGTPDEEHWDRFVEVRNDQHFDIVQRSIQQEREDRDLLNGLPWYQSMPARMMAATLDWPTALPGGAFVRGAKGGFSLLKSGSQVGAWTGVAAGAQEVGLHATQSLRTPFESAGDISASTLLGGIIGTAGAKLLTHAEWSSAVRNIERQAAEYVPQPEMPMVPIGAAAIAEPDWIRAFHGSPHEFERFDLSKIGTGEGAQVYGHGLYFAENAQVADVYAKQVLNMPVIDAANKRMSELAKEMEKLQKPGTYRQYTDPRGYELAKEYDDLMAKKTEPGKMYEARIRAKPEEFLDWDKPLSAQSEAIQKVVREHDAKATAGFTGEEIPGWGKGKPALLGEGDPTGAKLYARAHA